MNRPKGLTLTAILLALSGAWGLAALDYSTPHSLKRLGIFCGALCIGYVVVWFYWKGRNWARIGVLLSSGAKIFNLLRWNKTSPVLLAAPTHVVLAADAALGALLLYYLNTRLVLDYFYPEKEKTIPKYGWGRILLGLWIVASSVRPLFPNPRFRTSHAASTTPTVGMFVAVFVGVCLFAWGTRAGILPYHSTSKKSSIKSF